MCADEDSEWVKWRPIHQADSWPEGGGPWRCFLHCALWEGLCSPLLPWKPSGWPWWVSFNASVWWSLRCVDHRQMQRLNLGACLLECQFVSLSTHPTPLWTVILTTGAAKLIGIPVSCIFVCHDLRQIGQLLINTINNMHTFCKAFFADP